jgi:hypothetical protein
MTGGRCYGFSTALLACDWSISDGYHFMGLGLKHLEKKQDQHTVRYIIIKRDSSFFTVK